MVKSLLEGCGAAILLTLTYTWGQVSSYHLALFHAVLPIQSITAGALIDLLAASLACTAVAWWLARAKAGRDLAWGLAFAGLLASLVYDVSKLTERPLPWLRPGVVALIVGAMAVLLWRMAPRVYGKAIDGARVLLSLLGCSIFWIVPQLVYGSLHHEPTDQQAFHHASVRTQPQRRERIVWVLFDELSYDQLFDHRAAGLQVPNFDRLREESVSFSDLQPEAFYTERVTTSLMLGRPVADVRSDWSGDTIIKLADTHRWERFDGRQSVFADAERAGWSTGVVGWFNPYCRMLAGVVDDCAWRFDTVWPGHMRQGNSALHNAAMPLLNEIRRAQHKPSADLSFPAGHLDETVKLIDGAARLIRDEKIRFVYIHLPLPHPPGVYDRRTGMLRAGGSYLDNLAFTDRVLGELRAVVEQTASAQHTTLVVCSDHAFRMPLWRGGYFWTAEDERATAGRFDPRPVLLVHFPGQQLGSNVDAPTPGLILHAILEGMLHATVTDAAALRAIHAPDAR